MNQNPPYVPIAGNVDDEIDFVHYLDVVFANRWLISAITGFVLLIAISYSFLVKPIYEADILIQVEENPNSAKSLLGDVSALFDVKTEAAAEIEILSSRMVVGKAVDSLRLYIDAKPKYFPIIGEWVANRADGLSNPGFLGMGGFAWGREDIDVSQFEVPEELQGERFKLTTLSDGKFQLESSELDQPIKGQVGQVVQFKNSSGIIKLLVSELKAKQGAVFYLVRNSELKTLESLRDELKITEKGKQSGIIGASLRGDDRVRTAKILNEIGEEYVAQNIRRKSAEAEKSLVFLDDMLPRLKNELERAEARYNVMRDRRGTFNISDEGKAYLQDAVSVKTNLMELKQKRTELLTRFSSGHPSVIAIDRQILALSSRQDEVTKQLKSLPDLEQDALRLMRDVQVNNDLYVGLLNSVQQLRLVKAGKIGNVRLVDSARIPEKPVKPNKSLIVTVAIFMGLALGVVIAFIRNALYGGITESQDIEQHTGLNVYATVPLSPVQVILAEDLKSRKHGQYLLASNNPNEPSIESLRSMRTALQFAMLDADNNRVLLMGPTPGVGKSFISANLAAVSAIGGKSVLLIDADMRKGYLNQYFGKDRSPGLSDVLAGKVTIDSAIHRSVIDGLDFLSTGTLPPNPAELLIKERMVNFLDGLSQAYDLVLIDTPPILAVSDTAILASRCGTSFLVTRYGKTTIGEIQESVKQLRHANVEIKGVIFNGLDPKAFRYGYGSKYGRYRYASYSYDPAALSDKN